MRLNILITFLLASLFSFSQTPTDCARFKDGKFEIKDKKLGNANITRKGKWQIEESAESGVKIKLRVKWQDECTYTLKLKKVLENPYELDMQADQIIKVTIVETKENSYIQRTTIEGTNFVYQSEMFLLE